MPIEAASRRARGKARATFFGLPGMVARLRTTPIALPVLWNHRSLPVNNTLPGAADVCRTEVRELG